MIAALTWLANVFHPIKLYKPIYIKKACANTNTTQANTWRDFSITTTAVNVWFILLISSSRDTSISCFFFFCKEAYGGLRWYSFQVEINKCNPWTFDKKAACSILPTGGKCNSNKKHCYFSYDCHAIHCIVQLSVPAYTQDHRYK